MALHLNDCSGFEGISYQEHQLVLLTAENAIRPAIGNPFAALAGKARFFAKKYYPEVELILRSIAERRVEIFLKKPEASEVQRSVDLADLFGITCRIAGLIEK